MKYITLFETAAAYNESILDLPNVSLIEENMSISYNPYMAPETRVVAKYNVTDTSNLTQLCNSSAVSGFSAIEIDGVEQPSVINTYTFDTLGEHTVKFTLTDPTSIGFYAFAGCIILTSIVIPNSVTIINDGAFIQCSSLTSCTIGSGVTSIGANAFTRCSSLTSITIPNNVTSIGYNTFQYCSSLTSIVIPDSVTSIGASTFRDCTSLTSCTIGNGVTSIDESAFQDCTSLTSCIIGSGVTSMGNYIFKGCSSLTSIISNTMTAPTVTGITFVEVNTGGTLTVPSGSTGYDTWMNTDYLGNYNWSKVEQ